MHATSPARPRRLTLLVIAIVTLGGLAVQAAEPDPPIVHDPEAAAELAAVFEALWALPSFRQTHQDVEPLGEAPRSTEHHGAGRMRMLQEDTVGSWKGTTETVARPGRAAIRFVSPELDAHLATLAARQRAATLASIGGQVRQILQGVALGPAGVLSAVQGGLSLLGAGRGVLSDLTDADAYGRWHCVDLPELPIPGAGAAAGGSGAGSVDEGTTVERLPSTSIDGEPVRGYRSVSDAGGARVAHLTWVLESSGLPRRAEMSIEMPGFSSRSVMDFTDHGVVEPFEDPPCLDQGGR